MNVYLLDGLRGTIANTSVDIDDHLIVHPAFDQFMRQLLLQIGVNLNLKTTSSHLWEIMPGERLPA